MSKQDWQEQLADAVRALATDILTPDSVAITASAERIALLIADAVYGGETAAVEPPQPDLAHLLLHTFTALSHLCYAIRERKYREADSVVAESEDARIQAWNTLVILGLLPESEA